MLIRFSAENHLSIRRSQELSLVASSLKDVETSLIACDAVPNGKILPTAIIYGANASGKSNVVSALRFMRNAILLSHSRGQPGENIPRHTFGLDPKYASKPSIFDIDFTVDDIRYHYGFECTDSAFISEWLIVFPKGRRQALFERTRQEFKFGRGLRGRNKIISDLTRPNSLFLSAAAQNDHTLLSRVAEIFRSISFDSTIDVSGTTASFRLDKGKIDKRIIKFLEKVGTGVVDYRRQENIISEELQEFTRAIANAMQKIVKDESTLSTFAEKDIKIDIQLAHRGVGGDTIFFNLESESAGTRRLLILLSDVFHALDEGSVLVVDELDASLHTLACECVLSLFASPSSNPKGAQLIATTHDTNLLSSSFLRRDQVWFTEKDGDGATILYPLSDIRSRKGDNIEKGYLQGRYGAIPFAGSAFDLLSPG